MSNALAAGGAGYCGVCVGALSLAMIIVASIGLSGGLSLQATSITSIVLGIFGCNGAGVVVGIMGACGAASLPVVSGVALGGAILAFMISCCCCSAGAAALSP